MTFERRFFPIDLDGDARTALLIEEGQPKNIGMNVPVKGRAGVLSINRVTDEMFSALRSGSAVTLTDRRDFHPSSPNRTASITGRQLGDGRWFLHIDGDGIAVKLQVDHQLFATMTMGTPVRAWMTGRDNTPAATAPAEPDGWRFELPLGESVNVPLQQVCALGIIVGAAGGQLERVDEAMVFTGPGGRAPELLQDWCRNNDVTPAIQVAWS